MACTFARGFALAAAVTVMAGPTQDAVAQQREATTPIHLIGVIPLPGNPLVTSDIIWVDPGTRRLYVTDRSNFGIDIIDADTNLFVGRVTGFAGPEMSRGDPNANAASPPPNGEGPSGILVTPDKKVWAGDGNSVVRVVDVDPSSPNYLKIIQSISTAIPECGAHCDRADEIAYDPADHIIVVANNQPLAATATTPATPGNPYATFINADTYQVLGHVTFEGATGLEQPLWIPDQRRFFISVPGYRNNGGSNGGFGELAVIDPKSMKVTKSLNPGTCHPSAEALGSSQHVLVSCGGPVVLDAADGRIISTITKVGGGDENWYNPGDGRFYFTGNDKSTPPVMSLGVVDAQTGAWLQNVPDPGGRQAAALPANNHIFTLVRVTAAMVKDPSRDTTVCAQFGFKGTGCIAVFAHADEGAKPK
jgi:hypothetical protein